MSGNLASVFAYKAKVGQATERLRALFEQRATDRVFAAFQTPNATLAECRAQNLVGVRAYRT